VRVHLLALRERARSWVNRLAVSAGVVCIHAIDLKAWRPGSRAPYGAMHPFRYPVRQCRYCDSVEPLTREQYFAYFGHDFRARVGV
jgi:hypothetical protein